MRTVPTIRASAAPEVAADAVQPSQRHSCLRSNLFGPRSPGAHDADGQRTYATAAELVPSVGTNIPSAPHAIRKISGAKRLRSLPRGQELAVGGTPRGRRFQAPAFAVHREWRARDSRPRARRSRKSPFQSPPMSMVSVGYGTSPAPAAVHAPKGMYRVSACTSTAKCTSVAEKSADSSASFGAKARQFWRIRGPNDAALTPIAMVLHPEKSKWESSARTTSPTAAPECPARSPGMQSARSPPVAPSPGQPVPLERTFECVDA